MKQVFISFMLLLLTAAACNTTIQTNNPDARLNNIWVVETVNGEELQSGDFQRGLPVLELSLAEKHVGGHDGCNQMMGSFTATSDTISFYQLAGSMMACPETKSTVHMGMLLSGQTFTYRFGKGKLFLIQNGNTILQLKNID
jgi:heat shock protein HslJ